MLRFGILPRYRFLELTILFSNYSIQFSNYAIAYGKLLPVATYLLVFPRGKNTGGEALVGRSFRTLLKLLAAGGAAVSISSAAQATLVYDTSLASPVFITARAIRTKGSPSIL